MKLRLPEIGEREIDGRLVARFRRSSMAAGAVGTGVGVAVLLGWALDIAPLKTVAPGLASMKANTAVGFVLIGLSLGMFASTAPSRIHILAGAAAASLASALGLLTLAEYGLGWDLRIDELLFPDPAAPPAEPPGRMAPTTAACLLVLGYAQVLVGRGRERAAALMSSLVALTGFIAILGYLYGVSSLYGVAAFTSMALHTAVLFVVVALGVLVLRPERLVVAGRSAGGILLRRLLPPTVLGVVGLGGLWLASWRAGLYDASFGVSVMVAALVVGMTSLIAWTAGSLDRLDRRRIAAEQSLRDLNLELEERVRRRAAELTISEQRAAAILATSADAFVEVDADARITDWNHQAELTFGWTTDEVLGRLLTETIIPERFRQAHEQGVRHYLATGEGPVIGQRVELSALHRDGHEFPVELAVWAMAEADATTFNAFVRDISERKAAELELQASEERVRTVNDELRHGVSLLHATLEATTDGIAAVDATGKPVVHNRRFLEMWGLPDTALGSQDHTGVFAAMIARLKDPEPTLAALRLSIEGGEEDGWQPVELADGRVFEVRFHPQRLGQEVIGRVWSVRDVTESHRHGEALERSRAEAEQARDEADRANKAKSDFLSRMSHELRTPLNAVLGFGQLLQMRVESPREQEVAAHILKAGKHLLDLINEVLDIARIESGELSLSVEEVNVGEVFADVLDLVGPMAADRGITVEGADVAGASTTVLADCQRLKQVMLNLVANAVKYNRKNGTVRLSARDGEKGTVRLEVADTGPGIPPEKVGRLFTPFDRIGAEQTEIEGTGLGLALSKRLVDAMGGTISVETRVGEGSIFRVELAAAEPQRVSLDEAAEPQPGAGDQVGEELAAPSHAGAKAPRMKLLYVEDNLSNLRLIEHLLELRPEVKLLSAMQGGLGIELARHHLPDLILLDLHLPDMNGADVLASLRSHPSTAHIPVVVLSADATPGQIKRLLDAGATDYLTKPLDLKRLLELLSTTALKLAGT